MLRASVIVLVVAFWIVDMVFALRNFHSAMWGAHLAGAAINSAMSGLAIWAIARTGKGSGRTSER